MYSRIELEGPDETIVFRPFPNHGSYFGITTSGHRPVYYQAGMFADDLSPDLHNLSEVYPEDVPGEAVEALEGER